MLYLLCMQHAKGQWTKNAQLEYFDFFCATFSDEECEFCRWSWAKVSNLSIDQCDDSLCQRLILLRSISFPPWWLYFPYILHGAKTGWALGAWNEMCNNLQQRPVLKLVIIYIPFYKVHTPWFPMAPRAEKLGKNGSPFVCSECKKAQEDKVWGNLRHPTHSVGTNLYLSKRALFDH